MHRVHFLLFVFSLQASPTFLFSFCWVTNGNISVWLMARHLLSLWFSHIKTKWNQKTSPSIRGKQHTLKSPHLRPRPFYSAVSCLIGHCSAASLDFSQAGVRPAFGGTPFMVQWSQSICCKLTSHECCAGSTYKSPLVWDATCVTSYWPLDPSDIGLIWTAGVTACVGRAKTNTLATGQGTLTNFYYRIKSQTMLRQWTVKAKYRVQTAKFLRAKARSRNKQRSKVPSTKICTAVKWTTSIQTHKPGTPTTEVSTKVLTNILNGNSKP